MFVDRVVNDFVNHVMQTALIRVADIHARAFPDRFQTFQFVDLRRVVLLRFINARRKAFGARIFVVLFPHDGGSGWHRKKLARKGQKTTNNLVSPRYLFPLHIGVWSPSTPQMLWSAAATYSQPFLTS